LKVELIEDRGDLGFDDDDDNHMLYRLGASSRSLDLNSVKTA
jgi:hypothetical protein